MIRPWTHRYANTSLWFREADPADPALDAVYCGPEPEAQEVADYLRNRTWLKAPPDKRLYCFQFGTDTEIVGYATTGIRSDHPHPKKNSRKTAPYQFIGQLAVERRFQGRPDPSGSTTYAKEIVAVIINMGKAATCVGVCLDVRPTNARAIAFWTQLNFQPDGDYWSSRMNGTMLRRRLIF